MLWVFLRNGNSIGGRITISGWGLKWSSSRSRSRGCRRNGKAFWKSSGRQRELLWNFKRPGWLSSGLKLSLLKRKRQSLSRSNSKRNRFFKKKKALYSVKLNKWKAMNKKRLKLWSSSKSRSRKEESLKMISKNSKRSIKMSMKYSKKNIQKKINWEKYWCKKRSSKKKVKSQRSKKRKFMKAWN